jgi:hypothetical protein
MDNLFLPDWIMSYVCTLQWIVTGNINYANKAEAILFDWVNLGSAFNMTDGDRILEASWFPIGGYLAAELLRHWGGSNWTGSDTTAFTNWVNTELKPFFMDTNISGTVKQKNNWATKGAVSRMMWGVFTDDQTLYNTGRTNLESLITFQVSRQGFTNVFTGFHYETCRLGNTFGTLNGGDLHHTMQDLGFYLGGAEVSKHQGQGNIYAFLGADEGWGMRTATTGHAPFFAYPARSGSSLATWPCAQGPYSQYVDNGEQPGFMAYYNQYRDPIFLELSNYYTKYSYVHWRVRNGALLFDRLTHNYGTAAPPPAACADGIDNDGDGLTDFGTGGTNDPGCTSLSDTDETNTITPTTTLRYVGPTATGTGDCSTAANQCTLATARSGLPAGGILDVAAGTYDVSITDLPGGISASQPTTIRSRTFGAAITVGKDKLSTAPGQVTFRTGTAQVLHLQQSFIKIIGINITTTGSGSLPAVEVSGDDVVLENMDIQAPTRTGSTCGVKSTSASARLSMRRVRVHRVGPAVNFDNTSLTAAGVCASGQNHVFEDSDFFDNEMDGIMALCTGCPTGNSNTTIRRNRSWANGGTGLRYGDGDNGRLEDNLVYRNGANGIYGKSTATRTLILNNVTDTNSLITGITSPGIRLESGFTGIVRNHISTNHPSSTEIIIDGTTSQVACTNNLSSDAADSTKCTAGTFNGISTNIWVDPNHATPASADFTLKAGSPAINNGIAAVATSADVGAGRAVQAVTLTGCVGAACDQGAYESSGASPSQLIVDLGGNSNCTDGSTLANNCTLVGADFDTTNKIEGTAAFNFDAVGERVTVPLNGFNRSAFTIAVSARATAYGGTRPSYILGHSCTTPNFSCRIQLKLESSGTVAVGLGGNPQAASNILGGPMPLNTFLRFVLVMQEGTTAGAGTAKVYVDNVLKSTITYTSLTQIDPSLELGNNDGPNQEGWIGEIDKLRIANYAWTPAEISSDCTSFCAAAGGPFDPLAFDRCTIGNINDVTIHCPLEVNPDPAICGTLANFDVWYGGKFDNNGDPVTPLTPTACSLTGTAFKTLTLTMATSPGAGVLVELAYPPTEATVTVENVIDPPTDILILSNCGTDSTGIIISCVVAGKPPLSLVQLNNFLVEDTTSTGACSVVPLLNLALTHGTTDSVLTLQRAIAPVAASVAISLTVINENTSYPVVNNFGAAAPAGGLSQDASRCRADGRTTASKFQGAPNTTCAVTSPGRVNVQLAIANQSGANLTVQTRHACARDNGGGFGSFVLLAATNFNSIGLRYAPASASSLPDRTPLPSNTGFELAGLTFVSGLLRRTSQPFTFTLANNQYTLEEVSVELQPSIPLGTRFVCRAVDVTGTAFPTYVGEAGCGANCGAILEVSRPRVRSYE